MVLWNLEDQYLLLVDSHDPDLLVNVAVSDLEVNSDGPLLFCERERPKHAVAVEREELTLFTEADPSQDGEGRRGALSIDEDLVVACCHVDDLNAHCLASLEGWTCMVNDCEEVLITNHRHDRGSLAQQMFLDPVVREDSDVVEVCLNCAPATADREALHRLIIFEFKVPRFHVFPLVERLEHDVGILASLRHLFLLSITVIHVLVFFQTVVLILVLALLFCSASQDDPAVVERGHAHSKVVLDAQVAVEVLVGEFDIDGCILELMAHAASSDHVPVEDADFTFLGVVLAVGNKYQLCVYINHKVS